MKVNVVAGTALVLVGCQAGVTAQYKSSAALESICKSAIVNDIFGATSETIEIDYFTKTDVRKLNIYNSSRLDTSNALGAYDVRVNIQGYNGGVMPLDYGCVLKTKTECTCSVQKGGLRQ